MPHARPTSISFTRRLGLIIARCQALLGPVFNPYRPELHYMRGRGPKWHEKHGAAYAVVRRRAGI
jgi:hypothetical protein